jgi:hypothetical protein
MKRFLYLFSIIFIGSFLMQSCQDELDTLALTDFPPGILSISPGDGNKVVKGDFNVVVKFVDGSVSPLASATVTLSTDGGTQLATQEKSLSGTLDSIVIEGSTFSAADLDAGLYHIAITVADVKGQSQTTNTTFEISLLPFAANNDQMFMSGSFNGWGSAPMTLVADHIWEAKEVTFDGGEWKVKNCDSWCDKDWGSATGSSGYVSETTGGGANASGGPSGLYNFRFNDQTLEFAFVPAVLLDKNAESLYLLGTFNTFEGADYPFNLTGDNTWVLNEVVLKGGDAFRFAEFPDFMGKNWGDNEGDGIAEAFGKNIVIPADAQEAFYDISFNDKTLAYEVKFLRYPSIGIIGSSTPGGWGEDTNLNDNGDGTFSIFIGLTAGEVKFRANDDWATNWGGSDAGSGVATLNGPNIPVPAEGLYYVVFNPSTGDYSLTEASIGLIGSATPGGWGDDTNMSPTAGNPNLLTLTMDLIEGEAKFRANDSWDWNWGGADFPGGVASQNGPNIPVPAGTYTIEFNMLTKEYSFK